MKRIAILGFALLLLACTVMPAAAAPRKPAIDAGADRVVQLQRTDSGWEGTWYWYVGSTGNATNLTGVTALGLLEAYRDSKDVKYLDSAKQAAAFIMTHLGAGATGTQHHVRTTAPDIVFLHRLAQVTGDNSYADRANLEWGNIKGTYPTAGALDTLFRSINRPSTWDFAFFLEAAKLSGDDDWADDAASIIKKTDDDFYYDTASSWYALNLAGSLRALIGCGYAGTYQAEVATLLNKLIGTISKDNIGGYIQDTAYGVMALKAVGGPATPYANAMAKWLSGQQTVDGGWIEGGNEYPEIDGEALRAIAATIGTNTTIQGYKPKATANNGWRAKSTSGPVQAFAP